MQRRSRPRAPRFPGLRPGAAALCLAAVAAGITACGGEDPKQVLKTAFDKPIGSARVSFNATLRVEGVPNAPQPIRLSVSGPYQSGGTRRLPQVDWRADAAAGPRSLSGRLVSTGDNVFIGTAGRMYEVGEQQVAQVNRQLAAEAGNKRSLSDFGIKADEWLRDASTEDDVTVAGVETTHITGKVDVPRMLQDLNSASRRAGGAVGAPTQLSRKDIETVERVVKDAQLDAYVGKQDDRVRRLAVKVRVEVPEEERARVNGMSAADGGFTVEFADVGKPQRVVAPRDARPLRDFQDQLQGLAGGLGGAGGATPGGGATPPGGAPPEGSGGGGSGSDAERFEDYGRCLERAGDDTAAQRRCAAIIR